MFACRKNECLLKFSYSSNSHKRMREKWRLQCVLHRAKLLVAFTLVVVCTCHARALGQNDRISLHVNDAALSDVLRQIEDLSGYMFVYKSGRYRASGEGHAEGGEYGGQHDSGKMLCGYRFELCH